MPRGSPEFTPAFIELSLAVIASGKLEGQFRYFIDVVEIDGSRLALWDGDDYDEAVQEAMGASVDFDVPAAVLDLVAARPN